MNTKEYDQKKWECWAAFKKQSECEGGCLMADAFFHAFDRAYRLGMEAAKKQPWISVNDVLPEDDRLVIIHIDETDCPSEISTCTGYYEDGAWHFPDDYYYDCHVSHWMEIPAIPGKDFFNETKEENNG